jgi:hypothetical protein
VRARWAGAVLLTLAACTNDGGTCGPTAECIAPAAELEVSAVTVGSAARTHPVTGLRVVDSLRISYTVRNVGAISSDTTPVRVTVPISWPYDRFDTLPPIAAGQSVTRTMLFPSERVYFDGDYPSDKFAATVALETTYPDATSNNSRTSDTAHLALPILKVTVQRLAEPRVRVNDPIRMSATITNLSAIAPARDIQLRHCLWDYDVGCWAGYWTAFGTTSLPDIGPGETRTISYTTAIPETGAENGNLYYSMSVCVTARADNQPYRSFNSVGNGTWICGSAGQVEVMPDYEACRPPMLGVQPVTLTAPNCGIYPMPTEPGNWTFSLAQKLFYVFTLDAIGGQTYSVTGLEGGRAYLSTGRTAADLDPAAERVRFESTGRYYFIIYAPTGVRTATAAVVP